MYEVTVRDEKYVVGSWEEIDELVDSLEGWGCVDIVRIGERTVEK